MNSDLIRWQYAEMWYNKILSIFNFDRNKDIEARDYLYDLRKEHDIEWIIRRLEGLADERPDRSVVIAGAGPSLNEGIDQYAMTLLQDRKKYFIASADGATLALLEREIVPDIVFSDLDGLIPEVLHDLSEKRVLLIVHAHGDNIDKLKGVSGLLSGYNYLIGTTQTVPKYPIINPGGFTDGDRAVVFLNHIFPQKTEFSLIGFDYNGFIGPYSKPFYSSEQPITDFKNKKLTICKEIIRFISMKYGRKINYHKQT